MMAASAEHRFQKEKRNKYSGRFGKAAAEAAERKGILEIVFPECLFRLFWNYPPRAETIPSIPRNGPKCVSGLRSAFFSYDLLIALRRQSQFGLFLYPDFGHFHGGFSVLLPLFFSNK